MFNSQTNTIHHQAEQLREQEKFYQALELYQQVINQYLQNQQTPAVAEALQGMALTYKHLYWQSKNEIFIHLAQGAVATSLQIAASGGNDQLQANAHHLQAELFELTQNWQEAVDHFQQAMDLYPNQDALLAKYQYHLGAAQYQLGDKTTGKKNLEQGLAQITQAQNKFDQYTLDVWHSGALLALARLLRPDEPELAEQYLKEAQEVIESNPELKIREKQYLRVKEEFD